jgi:hypothetical protein
VHAVSQQTPSTQKPELQAAVRGQGDPGNSCATQVPDEQ